MRRRGIRAGLLLALATVVFTAGCEPQSPIGGPSMFEPQASLFSQRSYTLVKEDLSILQSLPQVSVVLGREGGTLSLLGHDLIVPKNAVNTPTVFLMSVARNGNIEVELQALQPLNLLNKLLDVGGAGFIRPVEIALSYSRAKDVVNPKDLLIVQLKDDGSMQAVPSRLDTNGQKIRGTLKHFSKYAMASN
jgi:hypothetical protein